MPFRFVPSDSFNRRSVRIALVSLSALIVIALMAFTARAWRMKNSTPIANDRLTPTSPQLAAAARNHPSARLGLQPEADKQRRRLGRRFLMQGRETSVLIGTLTLGSERFTARIARNQDGDDERLTIALNSGEPTLSWSGLNGALSDGSPATGNLRSLVERIALDSPDQFVLAQLRGAAYYTVARMVRPSEAGGSDNYAGPVWDIVRISEPADRTQNKPQSSWRLYHINAATGLIDKVVSREQGQTITAEFSGWVNQGGEQAPTRVIWTQNRQVVMELSLSAIAHGPKQ